MPQDIMTTDAAAAILSAVINKKNAEIFRNTKDLPFSVQTITFDLSTAVIQTQPKKIGFPFKSFYVADATDTNVSISMKTNSNDETQSAFPIKKNDSWESDEIVNSAFLFWSAQPAKSITLVFFTDARFRSGSQISVTGGGVAIIDGSTITGPTRATLAAATAGIIAPALSTRKVATIQNKTSADLYIGASAVTNSGANEGIVIPANGIIYWRNTGALYGYSVAGGNVHRNEEE